MSWSLAGLTVSALCLVLGLVYRSVALVVFAIIFGVVETIALIIARRSQPRESGETTRPSPPCGGGSANDYDYAAGDPVNSYDLDGTEVRGRCTTVEGYGVLGGCVTVCDLRDYRGNRTQTISVGGVSGWRWPDQRACTTPMRPR